MGRLRLAAFAAAVASALGPADAQAAFGPLGEDFRISFMGPNGISPDASVAPYTMQVYRNVDPGYGFPTIPLMSPTGAWRAYQANPLLYQKTEAQRQQVRALAEKMQQESRAALTPEHRAQLDSNVARISSARSPYAWRIWTTWAPLH